MINDQFEAYIENDPKYYFWVGTYENMPVCGQVFY